MKILQAIRSGHPASLFSAFLYFDVSFMVWVILGPLAVYMASDLGLSATEKGFIVAVPLLGGALLRIPMGILTDRIGPRSAGLVGLLLTLVPLLGGWLWANSLTKVMVVGLLLGVAGASFAVALPLASRCYPREHQGLAMGIAGAGNSGTVLSALLAPRLAEYVGWQGVLGLAALPVLLTLVLFAWLTKEGSGAVGHKPLNGYRALLREKDAMWFSFFYSITFGGFVGLASYLVIFFHEQYGLPKVIAGNFTAACVFAGSFFRPVGGYIADRFGGVRALAILYFLAGVLMVGVSLQPPLIVVSVLLFFVMMALGMGNGSVFQLVPKRFAHSIGAVTGMVGAAGGLGGSLLPLLLGGSKNVSGSYMAGFLAFGIISFTAFLLLELVYHRSWSRTWLTEVRPSMGLSPTGRVAMEVVFGG